jgi:hypothetical protein
MAVDALAKEIGMAIVRRRRTERVPVGPCSRIVG